MSGMKEDMDALLGRIATSIETAMPIVGEEVKLCIAEHVIKDVYEKRKSNVYPASGNLLRGAMDARVTAGGMQVTVEYSPDPENKATWGQMPPEKMKRYGKKPGDLVKEDAAATPDEFIARVETGNYPFKTSVGERPFLSNAMTELIEGRRALRAFIDALNVIDNTLNVVDAGDVEIVRTADDFGGD